MEKLRFIFSENGLGKYYVYTKGLTRSPFIEMNINMYKFSKKLFYWVLNHELDHYIFFSDASNERKKDLLSEIKMAMPNLNNISMIAKQAKFEIKFRDKCFKKTFAVNEDKTLLTSESFLNYHNTSQRLDEREVKELLGFIGGVRDI